MKPLDNHLLGHSLHEPLVLSASVPMAQSLGQNLVLMTCIIRVCLMNGDCVAGLLFEGLGASRRTRKNMQKLRAEERQLKATVLLCPCLQMTVMDPLCSFIVQTHGVHQTELVFQCFSWAKNTLN